MTKSKWTVGGHAAKHWPKYATGATIIETILHGMGLKEGGRVRPRGVGKATHGYGKAMKKK